jgi:opacity protein-like surface antigen
MFLDLKLMLGAVKVNSPELDLTGSQSGATATVSQGISTAVAFAYCVGAGFKFDVDKDICILLHADYLQANPQYVNVPITATGGGTTHQTFTQNINIISISTGVAFKIN